MSKKYKLQIKQAKENIIKIFIKLNKNQIYSKAKKIGILLDNL